MLESGLAISSLKAKNIGVFPDAGNTLSLLFIKYNKFSSAFPISDFGMQIIVEFDVHSMLPYLCIMIKSLLFTNRGSIESTLSKNCSSIVLGALFEIALFLLQEQTTNAANTNKILLTISLKLNYP